MKSLENTLDWTGLLPLLQSRNESFVYKVVESNNESKVLLQVLRQTPSGISLMSVAFGVVGFGLPQSLLSRIEIGVLLSYVCREAS